MLRTQLSDALKVAMKAKESLTVSTIRLIMAALKDRDIAARSKGNMDGVPEDEILTMLQSMIKQRRESVEMYEKGGRLELAEQENLEIDIIKTFLPEQLDAAATVAAIDAAIADTGAVSLKDMGKVMGVLKERYAGRMEFSKVSASIKEKLS